MNTFAKLRLEQIQKDMVGPEPDLLTVTSQFDRHVCDEDCVTAIINYPCWYRMAYVDRLKLEYVRRCLKMKRVPNVCWTHGKYCKLTCRYFLHQFIQYGEYGTYGSITAHKAAYTLLTKMSHFHHYGHLTLSEECRDALDTILSIVNNA